MNAPNHIARTHRGVVTVELPLKTISEANARGHWSKRAGRAKQQRLVADLALRGRLEAFRRALWHSAEYVGKTRAASHAGGKELNVGHDTRRADLCQITMTRVSPGVLDDDNLRSAMKAIRDGVADALGIDDRDPRVTWAYNQERGRPGKYAVRIAVEATT